MVKRATPALGSSPTVPMSIPRIPIASPFRRLLPASLVRVLRPSSISAKYSGGPKERANRTMGPAINISPSTDAVPAMKDPKADIPSATPARPCRAIW